MLLILGALGDPAACEVAFGHHRAETARQTRRQMLPRQTVLFARQFRLCFGQFDAGGLKLGAFGDAGLLQASLSLCQRCLQRRDARAKAGVGQHGHGAGQGSGHIAQALLDGVAKAIDALGLGKVGTMLLLIVFYLILGCFMEGIAIMILMVPVFMPVIQQLGIDVNHFGVIVVMNLMIGILTPPFGVAPSWARLISDCHSRWPSTASSGGVGFAVVRAVVVAVMCMAICEGTGWFMAAAPECVGSKRSVQWYAGQLAGGVS